MSGSALVNVTDVETSAIPPSPIDQAKEYVHDRVQGPALRSTLPDSIKSKVKHADLWLDKFKRVGDLLAYLKRFDVSREDPIYKAMTEIGLLTFEDIVGDFERKFSPWANDCSRITDFVVGEEYSVFDILILARNYDTRAGGMFVIDADGQPVAVIIKATLKDGKYANEWLDEPTEFKYYLKSINNEFGEHFKANKAIIESSSIPIVTFVRSSKTASFVFRGIFNYQSIIRENGGAKAFVLTLNPSATGHHTADSGYFAKSVATQIQKSLASARADRLKRLAAAPRKPASFKVVTTAFLRNADVIAEVLHRAGTACERCKNAAPFFRDSDGTPYLEVHHRVQLANGGDDTVANAIALCPNCHRQQHYGVNSTLDEDPISTLATKI